MAKPESSFDCREFFLFVTSNQLFGNTSLEINAHPYQWKEFYCRRVYKVDSKKIGRRISAEIFVHCLYSEHKKGILTVDSPSILDSYNWFKDNLYIENLISLPKTRKLLAQALEVREKTLEKLNSFDLDFTLENVLGATRRMHGWSIEKKTYYENNRWDEKIKYYKQLEEIVESIILLT